MSTLGISLSSMDEWSVRLMRVEYSVLVEVLLPVRLGLANRQLRVKQASLLFLAR